jgi:hypothetical protein
MTKPSPALIVATLALMVAATGTASATGLIDGHSIRNHSITANKLAKGAVTSRSVATHAITKLALADGVIVNNTVIAPAGPKGDAGAAGANGVAAVDPSKLIVVNGNDVTVDVGTRVDSQANCPAGTYAVGGGYSEMQDGGNILVVATASQPLSNVNSSLQGWDVVARNMGGANQTAAWHAIAYCA